MEKVFLSVDLWARFRSTEYKKCCFSTLSFSIVGSSEISYCCTTIKMYLVNNNELIVHRNLKPWAWRSELLCRVKCPPELLLPEKCKEMTTITYLMNCSLRTLNDSYLSFNLSWDINGQNSEHEQVCHFVQRASWLSDDDYLLSLDIATWLPKELLQVAYVP